VRGRKSSPSIPDPPDVLPDPDQAWKALSLVNDWVKHAEAKLGVVLAVTGVSGGVLFNLLRDRNETSWTFDLAAVVCSVAIFAAGLSAMAGLYPIVRLQRRATGEAANPLFFHDVARAYKGDAPSYGAILHTLTTSPDDLVRHLGQQVHANATVAHRKYRWANRAIRALLLDLLALAALAAIIAFRK
jgi:hypothetical protein